MTSRSEGLKAGDTVVPLTALAKQCAALAGASSLAIVLYRAGASSLWVFAGIFLGAIAGLLVGLCFGRLVFPASDKHVVVVKAGKTALPKTLFAAATPSFITSIALALVVAFVFGVPSVVGAIAWAAGCALVFTCLLGFGSALA